MRHCEALAFLQAFASTISAKKGYHGLMPDVHGSVQNGAGPLVQFVLQTRGQLACSTSAAVGISFAASMLYDQISKGGAIVAAIDIVQKLTNVTMDYEVKLSEIDKHRKFYQYGTMFFFSLLVKKMIRPEAQGMDMMDWRAPNRSLFSVATLPTAFSGLLLHTASSGEEHVQVVRE